MRQAKKLGRMRRSMLTNSYSLQNLEMWYDITCKFNDMREEQKL